MPWTIPARPVVGDTDWNAEQEAIWSSLKAFVDGLEHLPFTAPAPKVSGQYLVPAYQTGAGGGASAYNTNSVYGSPVPIGIPFPIDGIIFRVSTAENGINVRASLYASDADGYPAALVATGTVTTGAAAATDYVATFAAVTPPPGLYWVFLRSDNGSTIRFAGFTAVATSVMQALPGTWDGFRQPSMRADVGTYAAPADPITAWTPAAQSTNQLPLVGLRRA